MMYPVQSVLTNLEKNTKINKRLRRLLGTLEYCQTPTEEEDVVDQDPTDERLVNVSEC